MIRELETTQAAQERLELDGALLELPRTHKMKTTDLGIDEASFQSVANAYAAGDETKAELCETAREVFLEMMSRTPSPTPRVVSDASGKPKLGPGGGRLVKDCSNWAVDDEDCRCINDTKDAPAPKPGYWREFVVKNWRQIMPRLVFASDNAAPGASATLDRSFNIETWKNTRDLSLSDKNADRQALKSWLIPFLKNPVSKWDGKK